MKKKCDLSDFDYGMLVGTKWTALSITRREIVPQGFLHITCDLT